MTAVALAVDPVGPLDNALKAGDAVGIDALSIVAGLEDLDKRLVRHGTSDLAQLNQFSALVTSPEPLRILGPSFGSPISNGTDQRANLISVQASEEARYLNDRFEELEEAVGAQSEKIARLKSVALYGEQHLAKWDHDFWLPRLHEARQARVAAQHHVRDIVEDPSNHLRQVQQLRNRIDMLANHEGIVKDQTAVLMAESERYRAEIKDVRLKIQDLTPKLAELEIGFDECMYRVSECLFCIFASVTSGRGDVKRKTIFRSRDAEPEARRFTSLQIAQEDDVAIGAKVSIYEEAISKFEVSSVLLLPGKCEIVCMDGECTVWVQDANQKGFLLEFPNAERTSTFTSLLGHLKMPTEKTPWKLDDEPLPEPPPVPIKLRKKPKNAVQSVFDLFLHNNMLGIKTDMQLLHELGMEKDGTVSRDLARKRLEKEHIECTAEEFENIVEFLENRSRKVLGIEEPQMTVLVSKTVSDGGDQIDVAALMAGLPPKDSGMIDSERSESARPSIDLDGDASPTSPSRKWKRGTVRLSGAGDSFLGMGAALQVKRMSRRSTSQSPRGSRRSRTSQSCSPQAATADLDKMGPTPTVEFFGTSASNGGEESPSRKWKRGTLRTSDASNLFLGLDSAVKVKRMSRRSTTHSSRLSKSPSRNSGSSKNNNVTPAEGSAQGHDQTPMETKEETDKEPDASPSSSRWRRGTQRSSQAADAMVGVGLAMKLKRMSRRSRGSTSSRSPSPRGSISGTKRSSRARPSQARLMEGIEVPAHAASLVANESPPSPSSPSSSSVGYSSSDRSVTPKRKPSALQNSSSRGSRKVRVSVVPEEFDSSHSAEENAKKATKTPEVVGPPTLPVESVRPKPSQASNPVDGVGSKSSQPASPTDNIGPNPSQASNPIDGLGSTPSQPASPMNALGSQPSQASSAISVKPQAISVYLPMTVGDSPVLVDKGGGDWLLDNSVFKSDAPGLGYRRTKNLDDRVGNDSFAAWGSIVVGFDAGHGWLSTEMDAKPTRNEDSDEEGEAAAAPAQPKAQAKATTSPPTSAPTSLTSSPTAPTSLPTQAPAAPMMEESSTLTLNELRDESILKAHGVDPTRKEQYLSEDDFMQVFGVTKASFESQPKWKRDKSKRENGLF
jgi:hypothetical protein